MYKLLVAAAAVTFVLFSENANASGRGRITVSQVDSGEDVPRLEPLDPRAIPDVTEHLPEGVRDALLERAAAGLATAIRDSRRQAVERGVDPIPPLIRAALDPYFPPQILDKAKWTTAAGISLDGVLTNWFNLEGAVTLGEVIAFSDGTQTQDVELWAHELTHVVQYEELGIETFAFQYVHDFSAMENQASSNASRIMASIAATLLPHHRAMTGGDGKPPGVYHTAKGGPRRQGR